MLKLQTCIIYKSHDKHRSAKNTLTISEYRVRSNTATCTCSTCASMYSGTKHIHKNGYSSSHDNTVMNYEAICIPFCLFFQIHKTT